MSMASRAVNRLRELYRGVLLRNRTANAQRDGYPSQMHRQCTHALIEALEPRLMLSGSYALWGGFADYRDQPDAYEHYMHIDEEPDYTLLAESSEENTTFTGDGEYDFYVFAATGTVEVDAFTASNGDHPPVTWSSNAMDTAEMQGPADGVYGLMAGQSATGTYGSYVVMENPGTWDGLSVEIANVTEVIFSIGVNEYYGGFAEPDSVNVWVSAETSPYNDLELTSVSLQTPSGEVYHLAPESSWQWELDEEISFSSRQEANEQFPADTYTFTYSGPWGSQSTEFFLGHDGQSIAWPTQKPEQLSPSMGETGVGIDTTLTWEAVTDPHVTHIWNYVEEIGPEGDWNRKFADAADPSETSVEVEGLDDDRWHEWGMSLSNRQSDVTDDGHYYAVTKATENRTVFRTSGGDPGEPDLFFDVTAWEPGTYLPGAEMAFDVRGGNQGDGVALATDAEGNLLPVALEVRLSTDFVWGDADDVLVYATQNGYWLPGDVFDEQGVTLTVPDDTPPGTYYGAVRIDAGEMIAESDETNNTWWSPWNGFDILTSDGDEPNDTPAEATVISVDGSAHTANLSPEGDEDWYRFELAETQDLVIQAASEWGGVWIELYSPDGSRALGEPGWGGNMGLGGLEAGEYALRVWSDWYSGSYDLSLWSAEVTGETFADPALELAVRAELGRPTGVLDAADLTELDWLNAGSRGISDLSGLEACTNLYGLSLWDNDISDLTPLEGLASLEYLYLDWNRISDLTPLSNLDRLAMLDVSGNEITSLAGLENLAAMEELSFEENRVSDLTPLSNLTNLVELWAIENNIADLSPLAGLTQLEALGLSENAIEDLSPLAGLSQLETLIVSENWISDLSPLSGMAMLRVLDADDNLVSDPTPLEQLDQLEKVMLSGNQLTDVSFLSGLESPRALGVGDNPLTDLSPVLQHLGLVELDIQGVGLTDLTAVEDMTSLEKLDLSGNAIADLSGLANLTELTELLLDGNPASDLSPLVGLTKLRELAVMNMGVSDLTPLSGLVKLEDLELDGNSVSDLSPLAGLTRIEDIEMASNPVSDLSPLAGMTSLEDLDISRTQVTDLSPLAGLGQLRELLAMDANISDLSPLAEMDSLKVLDLPGNEISDLSPLADWDLDFLSLWDNNVTDLSPLLSGPAMGSGAMLLIGGNPLSAMAENTQVPALESLGVTVYTFPDPDAYEPDDTVASATTITLDGASQAHGLHSREDVDWVRFTLDELTSVRVAGQTPLGGPEMTLYAVTGGALVELDYAADVEEGKDLEIRRVGNQALSAGEYYIRLASEEGVNPAFPFELSVETITDPNAPVTVSIPDPTLDSAVRSALGMPSGDITNYDLRTLQSLVVSGASLPDAEKISDLSGLQYAVNLTELRLEDNRISSVSPLEFLTDLEVLDLGGNQITDLAGLVDNTGLGDGDVVVLTANPLSESARTGQLPALEARGVHVAPDSYEPSDDLATGATAIVPNGDAQRHSLVAGDADWYTFAVDEFSNVTLITEGEYGDTELWLYEEDGQTLIGQDGDSGSGAMSRIERAGAEALPAGTYLVKVTAGAGSDAFAYELSLTASREPMVVSIPDAALEAALRDALGKPAGDITDVDLETLTELDASPTGGEKGNVSDLTGLEYCVNLIRLDLTDNQVTDLSPLGGLDALEELELSLNSVGDLGPLAGLANLRQLGLWGNPVQGIGALGGLTGLQELTLGSTGIADITALSSLTNLQRLSLAICQITDIEPLADLTQLEFLDLGVNDVVNIQSLENMTSLETLDLRNNPLTSIEPLSGLTSLRSLELVSTGTANVQALRGLTNLGYLGLGANDIVDISPLVDNTGLSAGDELQVHMNPLSIESFTTHVEALEARGVDVSTDGWIDPHEPDEQPGDAVEISTDGTALLRSIHYGDGGDWLRFTVDEFSGLTIVTGQTEGDTMLWLYGSNGQTLIAQDDDSGVGNASRIALSGDDALEAGTYYIKVTGAGGSYVPSYEVSVLAWREPFAVTIPDAQLEIEIRDALGKPTGEITDVELEQLTILYADGPADGSGGIADLSGLEYCTNLRWLHLANNDVSELSPLAGLTELYRLDLSGNQISEVSPLSSLTGLTSLDLDDNEVSDLTPLAGLDQLYRLDLANNQVDDISLLDGLTHLSVVTLHGNEITDIGPLARFTNWGSLDLHGNEISDLSPLSSLTYLRTLDLSDNVVSDLTPLSALTRLEDLDLSDNEVADVSPLLDNAGLGWGDTVNLNGNPLSMESVTVHIPELEDWWVTVSMERWIDPQEPDEQFTDAVDVATDGSEIMRGIHSVSDADWMRFTVDELSQVVVRIDWTGLTDLSLYGDDGQTLIAGSEAPSYEHTLNLFDETALAPGTYYIKVSAPEDSDFETYRLSVEASPQGTQVEIPDANLEAEIRDALDDPTGYITDLDLQSLTALYMDRKGISDLTGLEHCVNLTSLRLRGNAVSDLTPLAGLTGLESLHLYANEVSDLTPLAGLDQLYRLDLANNQVADVSSLAAMTNLEYLYLAGNQVSDLTPLAGLDQLYRLDLANNQVADVTALSGMTKLKQLYAENNSLTSLKGMEALTSLGQLELQNNQITDLSPLSAMTELTWLDLEENDIADLSPLSGLTALTSLHLGNNRVSDISPLAGMTDLNYLFLEANEIVDISPLAGLTGLDWAKLHGNRISDISPLSGFTEWTHLDLHGNEISDLSPLTSLTKLDHLDLDDNQITDIAPLVSNTGLGDGDRAELTGNPLGSAAYDVQIPELEARGVTVTYDPLADAYEPDGTYVRATPLGLNDAPLVRSLTVGDSDWHVLTLEAETNLVLQTHATVGQTKMWLYDAEGMVELDQDTSWNWNGIGRIDRTGTNALSAGTYYLRVGALDPTEPVQKYEVSAEAVVTDGEVFADATLETAVRLKLDIFTGELTAADLATLTSLNVEGTSGNWEAGLGVSDLTGLGQCVNLRWLYLEYNQITDLTPLSGLNQLESLEIASNRLSSLEGLEGCTALSDLDVENNQVTDLTPLSGLDQLTQLEGRWNLLNDLAGLEGCTALSDLDVADNQISDLTALSGLTQIVTLDLSRNSVSDITPLSGVTALQYLRLTDNAVADITALEGLAELDRVYLANNQVSDISPLVANSGIGSGDAVYLKGNDLNDEAYTTHLAQLEDRGVYIRYSPPRDAYEPDDTWQEATELVLDGPVQQHSISFTGDADWYTFTIDSPAGVILETRGESGDTEMWLYEADAETVIEYNDSGNGSDYYRWFSRILRDGEKSLPAGTYYVRVSDDGNNNEIASYGIAAGTWAIDGTVFVDTAVEKAVRLKLERWNGELTADDLAGLTSLDLSWLGISDLSGLDQCVNLTSLDLKYNEISDLTPLASLSGLTHLYVSGNNIEELSPLSSLDQLVHIEARSNQISSLAGLEAASSLQTLELSHNEISDLAPLAGLAQLSSVSLTGNQVSDLTPLVENAGMAEGDSLYVEDNPLTEVVYAEQIPALEARGVEVTYDPVWDVYEPDNTWQQATELALDEPWETHALPEEDVDWFSFTLDGTTDLLIGSSYLDGYMELFSNPESSPIAGSSYGRIRAIGEDALTAGTYYIKVTHDGWGGPVEYDMGLRTVDIDGSLFADPVLELEVRLATDTLKGELSSSDLYNLTYLDAPGAGISDLSGIEHCTNLTSVYLGTNWIQDVSPLLLLSDLEDVTLTDNPLSHTARWDQITALLDRGVEVEFDAGPDRLEPGNDVVSQATPIAVGEELRRLSIEPSDVDWFTFRIDEETGLVLRTPSTGPFMYLGYEIALFEENGQTLIQQERGGDYDSDHVLGSDGTLPAGTYTLRLSQRLDEGPYTVPPGVPDYSLELAAVDVTGEVFADPRLEMAVRLATDQLTGSMTAEDVETLTSLSVREAGIASLAGIEHCTALTSLDAFDNQISDLSPLSGLTQLNSLTVGYNPITDLSPIAGLTELSSLSIEKTGISDLSPLSSLTGLGSLSAGENAITDLSPIAGLTELSSLSIEKTGVSDLSPLSSLTGLWSLSAGENAITEVSSLAGLASLNNVYLNDNQITDLSPLVANTDFGSDGYGDLDVRGNPLSEVALDTQIPELEDRGIWVQYSPGVESFEPNDTLADAVLIEADGTPYASRLSSGEDVDWYRFDLTDPQDIVIASGAEYSFPPMQVYAGDGKTLLAEAEGGRGIALRSPSAGSYYIRLGSPWGWGSHDYQLAVTPAELTGETFADPGLELAVRGALSQPTGSLDAEDLANLYSLDASGMGISDLGGIEACTGLSQLVLNGNSVSDLSPLAGLDSLSWLSVRDNAVKDLSALAEFPYLYSLDLSGNRVSDVSMLADISIQELMLADNELTDISPLAALDDLRELDISGNAVDDISAVSGMERLTALNLSDNWVWDLQPLDDLLLLEEFSAENNLISDVTPLVGLGRLHTLKLAGNQLTDLSFLGNYLSLHRFTIGGNPVSDLSPVRQHLGLAELGLAGLGLTDTAVIEGMDNLKVLDLGGNQITDLSSLANLSGLESLSIDGNPVGTLPMLAGLTGLEHLSAVDTSVSDLSPLAGLTALRIANLAGNPVADLSPLSSLVQLESLDISRTLVSDLTPLTSLSSLNDLSCNDASASDLTALADLDNLGSLELAGNDISDLTPLADLDLDFLSLWDNDVTDLTPLLSRPALTGGSTLMVGGNPLTNQALTVQLPTLRNAGVTVRLQPEPDAYEPDDDAAEAVTIQLDGSPQTHSHHNREDVDWARFTLDEKTNVRVLLQGQIGQPQMELYAATGGPLEPLTRTAAPVGADRLEIRRIGDEALSAGEYLIRLSADDKEHASPLFSLSLQTVDASGVPLAVSIPDANLEAVLRDVLDKPTGEITNQDMAALTVLDVPGASLTESEKIRDLTGLQTAVNLTELKLDGHGISNLAPLAALPDLDTVSLQDNWIRDISPLVANVALGTGDTVNLDGNPLDQDARGTYTQALLMRGVAVSTDRWVDGYEPDNAPAEAAELPTDGTVQVRSLSSNSDVDWVSITMAHTGELAITLDQSESRLFDVTLQSDDGSAVLQEGSIAGDSEEVVLGDRLFAGLYHLSVRAADDLPMEQYRLSAVATAMPPRVVGHDVLAVRNAADGPFASATVEFTQPMGFTGDETGGFWTDDVSLTLPGGESVSPTAIEDLGDGRYRLQFVPQETDGEYTLTIQPTAGDQTGQLLDQDGDGTAGEGSDGWSTSFMMDATAPLLGVSFPVGDSTLPLDHIDLAASEPLAEGALSSDAVTLAGPAGDVNIDSVEPLDGNVYRLHFAQQTADGDYTLIIDAAVADTVGNPLDTDGDGTFGETTDDQFVHTFTMVVGPKLTGVAGGQFHNIADGPLEQLTLTFSEPLDFTGDAAGSFWLDRLTLTGPDGAIAPTGIEQVGERDYRVSFAAQSLPGMVTVRLAADITDAAGHAMDQDRDGEFGEATEDAPAVSVLIGETAPVLWDGGGDGVNWHDAANWAGDVRPGAEDVVLLSAPGSEAVTFSGSAGSVSVAGLFTDRPLKVSGGSLTVTGRSRIDGALTVSGGTLKASGPDALLAADVPGAAWNCDFRADNGGTLDLSGITSLSDVDLYASSGGSILLPSATSYTGDNYHHTYIEASGAGSRIDLSGMEDFAGGGAYDKGYYQGWNYYWTYVKALGGGEVVLSGAVSANYDRSHNGTALTLSGAGSVLDVSGVTSLTSTNVTVDTVGLSASFDSATSLTRVNLTAIEGGVILFPSATSYIGNNREHTTLQASGAGSRIDLSGMEDFAGGGAYDKGYYQGWNYYWTYVKALGGGEVELAGDLTRNSNGHGNHITLDGEQSAINLAGVTSLYRTTLSAENGARWELPVGWDAVWHGGNTLSADETSEFVNLGELDVDGVTLTINAAELPVEGSLSPTGGGRYDVNGSLAVHGSGYLGGDSGGLFTIRGDLLGDTSAAADFHPAGTVRFDGSGTAEQPQRLEAMGWDIGGIDMGTADNFAYGTIALSGGTYVKLVDESDNTPGSAPEAVYASKLVVPAGTTLDLNGLNLYAETLDVDGTIIGGSPGVIGESLTVSTLSDVEDGNHGMGEMSLREAMAIARLAGEPMGITFDESLAGGTIALDAANGELLLDTDVAIAAPADMTVRITALGRSRVVQVAAGVTASLDGLDLTGGRADDEDATAEDGGGVYNAGSLTLMDVTVGSCLAYGSGGGVFNAAGGTLTVVDSSIGSNRATWGGGLASEGQLDLHSSRLLTNHAIDDGGGLYTTGLAELGETLISGNESDAGAGVYNAGTLTADGLLVTGNRATVTGGGLQNALSATATVSNATFTGNRAEDGGGFANDGGALDLTQVTLSGNRADGDGGGLYVASNDGSVDAVHVTVSANVADADQNSDGDGGGVQVAGAAAVTLSNSIVAGNFRGSDWRFIDDVAGGFSVESTHNLIGTVTGSTGLAGQHSAWGTDADPLDPRLDQLRDNGGFAPTQAIFIDSPAAEAGDNTVTNAAGLSADQRGRERIQDGVGDGTATVDMGAFEHRENHVPSLTGVQPLGGAVAGRPFRIGYDYLRHLAGASDADGDAIVFRVTGAGEGSFTRGGAAVVPGETTIAPGQDVIWHVPAGLTGTVENVLTVVATDGIGDSAPAAVNVDVTESAAAVNYAVLFSGGGDAELNSPRYYENVKRLYEVLTGRFGLSPHNVYVLCADGIDPQTDRSDGADSWMGYASRVQAATADALETTLGDLSDLVDGNDHFFFWSYDHGGGSLNPATEGEEVLKGWHSDISDEQLAAWLGGVDQGWRTYAFTQCYAGGMLDNLLDGDGELGAQQFGMSATTHYEASYGDSFAAALTGGLEQGYRYTGDVYEYTLTHDARATDGEGPVAGDPVYGVEHPWSVGESFPIFHDPNSAGGPVLHEVDPLEYDLVNDRIDITYDMLVAASDATDPDGDALVFRVAEVLDGTLTVDGQPVSPGVTQLRYGQTLRWVRPGGTLGEVNAFTVELLDDQLAASDAVAVPVRIGQITGTPAAENDLAEVSPQTGEAVIDVLANDRTSAGQSGTERLTVKSVGVALHGDVELLGGEVVYKATPGFTGTDVFTYIVVDEDDTVEMGQVEVIVTGYTAASPEVTSGYALTLMAAPPGYAALPESWSWYGLRDRALNWQETRPLAISDDGLVSVGITRGAAGSSNIDYYFDGGNTASYVWQIGMTVPYWAPTIEHPAGGGDPYIATATNTQMWLLPSGAQHPFDSNRTTVNGVQCVSIDGGNYALVEHWYVSPENAEDPPPPYGSILLEANTGDPLWHELDLDVIPQDVNGAGRAVGRETDYDADSPVPIGWIWDAASDAWEDRIQVSGWGGDGEADLRDVNASGQAVGWGEYTDGQYHAMRVEGGTAVDIGALPGDSQSFATNITDSGLIVGLSGDAAYYGGATYRGEAFLYEPDGSGTGTMTGLGTLLGREGSWSIAHDVSESGVVVGSSDGLAFVYAGGVMADLNDYIQTDWTLTEATGINSSGQIIATGERDGEVRAFVLDPVDKSAPRVEEVTLNDGLIRSRLDSISVRFSEDVSASDLTEALTILDSQGDPVEAAVTSVDWDGVDYVATWHLDVEPLPYGSYSAVLDPVDIADEAFNALSLADSGPGEAGTVLSFDLEPSITGRHVFYNNSVWDGNGSDVTTADKSAIATDKQALRPGRTASFVNYTSYSRGINGVMVDLDIAGDAFGIMPSDFVCKVGNSSSPSYWSNAPEPTVTVLANGGRGGSHRVALTWDDGVITKEWLQVTVKATARTGLWNDDVFYFGNAVGDTGDSASHTIVNAFDSGGMRDNPRTGRNPAGVENVYDIDRNRLVNAFDSAYVRDNLTTGRNALRLITAPGSTGEVPPGGLALLPAETAVPAAMEGGDESASGVLSALAASEPVTVPMKQKPPADTLAGTGVYEPVDLLEIASEQPQTSDGGGLSGGRLRVDLSREAATEAERSADPTGTDETADGALLMPADDWPSDPDQPVDLLNMPLQTGIE